MDKSLLPALLDAKNLTLDTLRKKAPALADEVVALVRGADGARLRQAFAALPAPLRAKVETIDLTETKGDRVEHLRARLVEMGVGEEDVAKAVRCVQKAKPAPAPPPTQPIGTQPAVAQQLATARVQETLTVAGLTGAAADAVAQAAPAPSALDDATLTTLVTSGTLTDAQATVVGFSSALYQLADGDTALATAIRSASFPALDGKTPTSTADLARLSAADWATFLASSAVALPAGVTAAAAATALAARFAALHPGIALMARLPSVDVTQVDGDLTTLAPLFQQNPKVVGVSFAALTTGSLGAAQIAALQAAQARLRQLSLAYPGLGLASVLDDPKLDPATKASTVARRTGLVQQVAAHLGDTQVLRLDLAPGSTDIAKLGLDQIGATADEQAMVLANLQANQRAWGIAKNVDDARLLIGAGYTSGLSMGRQPFSTFLAQSGLDATKGRAIYDEARTSMADSALTAGAILDATQGLLGQMAPGNQPPSVSEYLAALPGYQDLFGSLSFCDCQECQSILGPAAYFVDLMKYIDENVRSQFKAPGHPLDLNTRRPDLWTLELSCDNTNDRVATLDLVAEILENYIALGLHYSGSLTDRVSIGTLVYENTLTRQPPQTVDSFQQPFVLPLARIGSYLPELGSTRSAVAVALMAPATARTQAELGLSTLELSIATTPDVDLGHMSHLYGIAFGGAAAAVSAVDAAVLGPAMGVTRAELGQMVATVFVAAGGATVTIMAAKQSATSVQDDVEWVSGLTADALDRMHRLTRIVRKTGWAIPDLDMVLTTLASTTLDASAVQAVAELHAIQARFSLAVADLCALVGPIPTTPAGTSLFDRLFNGAMFVAEGGPFPPNPLVPFVVPAFRQTTTAPPDPALPRLLSGLLVDLGGLAALAAYLAPHLTQGAPPAPQSFNPTALDESSRYFVLSADNLTLLYRHARLCRMLGVSIDDLFQLLGFLGLDHVGGLGDLLSLLDIQAWWQESGYALDDIAVAIGQAPRDPSAYPDPGTVAAQIVASAATALTFTTTVFSVALGTSEQGSSDLLTSNSAVAAVVESSPTDGSFRIVAGIDLDTIAITIPPTATVTTPATATTPATTSLVTVADVRAALRPYLASEMLVRSLGTALGFSTDKVVALLALVGQPPTADGVVKVVRGDAPLASSPPASTPDALTALIAATVPLAVALAAAVWDATAVGFVQANQQAFGTGSLPQTAPNAQPPAIPFVSLAQLRGLSTYARLAQRLLSATPGPSAGTPADLQTVLAGFTVGSFPPASDAAMARVLGVPSGLVVGLRGQVTLPAVAAPALDQLDRAAQLAVALGVDGETLGAVVASDYDTLSHAADALVAALGARYTDDATRTAKLDEAEQPVRQAKRDALADYLFHSISPQVFQTVDELYEYFLIDVASGGCMTTSRVVSATMAAQLYVYRVIMNLERDSLPPTDPNHVALTLPEGVAAEWEWRKNYRVWQANREVFLWPENYLDPDLRDDKTPLFQDLESALLQTDIDDQNVLDAYTTYLTGLEEVASLTIAGVYHDVATDSSGAKGSDTPKPIHDVLHLFGVTADDPPIYYYRTCQNLIASGRDPNTAALWSPWQKIAVQITGRRVAPVVYLGRLRVFWIDIKTKSVNQVENGSSNFAGYQHQMTLNFTTLRPDGAWTAPQQVQLPAKGNFGPARGQIMDALSAGIATLDPEARLETQAIDDYTLLGPNWDAAWLCPSSKPEVLEIQFRNFLERDDVDLFKRKLTPADTAATASPLPYPQLLCARDAAAVAAAAKAVAAAHAAAQTAASANAANVAPYIAEAKAAASAETAETAAEASTADRLLYFGTPAAMFWQRPAFANAVIDEERLDTIALEEADLKVMLQKGLYAEQIATIPFDTDLTAVPGSEEDGVLQVGSDVLLLQGSVTNDSGYVLRRLGTTLVEGIARSLFEDGFDGMLATATQLRLAEAGLPIKLVGSRIEDRSGAGKLDFTGPHGVYYRELYFHIPFLIANALNSRGRFEAAQKWYQYVFDPTSSEMINVSNVPPGDVAHRLLDRVWRYREFRGLDVETMRAALTDVAAIGLYKSDPFNPWAIARRRISAFQKATVMKYVDNLLDWADSLFTQFTMESVNEAMMLYIMASDVLGARPTELGDCGAGIEPNTYETIGPLIDGSSDVLIESIETWAVGARVSAGPAALASPAPVKYAIPNPAIVHAVEATVLFSGAPVAATAATGANGATATASAAAVATPAGGTGMFRGLGWAQTRTASWGPALGNATIKTVDLLGGRSFAYALGAGFADRVGPFGWSILRQATPVFCIPVNADLLAYWDRVEDRLYKIRNCMNIDGQKQELALFAPPISPMQLVAMKAAGLSLDDVLGVSNGDLPPYRFLYLIDRAKAHAGAVSGFGAALLSSLEKKDGEQLSRLRLTQQMNLAQLTTQTRQLEIQAASASLDAVSQQLASAQYRSTFYAGLISGDRDAAEVVQSAALHTATGVTVSAIVTLSQAGALKLAPQIGSLFAMKYGGVELGGSAEAFAQAAAMLAGAANAVAASAGLEASFARRAEGWQNQKALADYDVQSLTKQQQAAQIRVDIANSALALHQKSIDQIQQMLDLTDGKFTNLGLYTWLSTQLQRVYRGAYQNALALAKLAEQAFRFERGDYTSPGLASSYWDPTHAGLLAGEQLLLDLQTLERRFLETNYRTLEVDQAFALSQVDAQALLDLRETGECTFTVSEVFFDLYYPGHYKRRIKAVRLTIPCVTGPYVNVSASLDLVASKIRPTATQGAALVDVPPSRTVSIATSTAQNDAGVFELSFRDERYMPFEGLGAVESQWHLSLPKSFRQFDYETINDVILSISYMAEQDGALRDRVEAQSATLEGSIVDYFTNNSARRLFSLRQDFSGAFTRLLRSAVGTQVKIELTDRNFPLFVRGRALNVVRGAILLRTAPGADLTGFSISVDSVSISASPPPAAPPPPAPPSTFTPDPTLPQLSTATLPGAFTAALRGPHVLLINAAGGLGPAAPPPGDVSAIDAEKLLDVLVYLEYRFS